MNGRALACVGLALVLVSTSARAQKAKLPAVQAHPAQAAVRTQIKLPPGVAVVSMRVPVGGSPLEPSPGVVDATPPEPLDAATRASLIPSRPSSAAPPPHVAVHPAAFVLTPQAPYARDAGLVRFNNALFYFPQTEIDENGGRGEVLLGRGGGAIELWYYAEEGRRYSIDLSLARLVSDPITLTVQAPGGNQDVAFGNERFHLFIIAEPSDGSGWALVLVYPRWDASAAWGTTPTWAFFEAMIRRLD